MDQQDLQRKIDDICQFLVEQKRPIAFRDIAEYGNLSQVSTANILQKLESEHKVSKTKTDRSMYYMANISMEAEDLDNLHTIIQLDTVQAKDDYEIIAEKMEKVEKNVNLLYANIISIIAIFVAIFSLITVNANIAFKVTEENLNGVFQGIIFLNAFVVVCIVILIMAVRIVLINPLIEKKKKRRK